MREILYDMIHNSMYGTIALIAGGCLLFYCALFLGAGIVWRCYYQKKDLSCLKRILMKGNKIRNIHYVIVGVALLICVVMFILFLFKDWRVEHQHFQYIQTHMAEQKSLDILFSNEIEIEINDNKELRKLHIAIGSPTAEITETEIEKRIEVFTGIYQAEIENANAGIESDFETEAGMQENKWNISGTKSNIFVKYLEEYYYWSKLFTKSRLPSDLYQSSRAARDMLEVGRFQCNDEELLEIAAEAVYRSELFLEYGSPNINTEDNPVMIEKKDVLLNNGKVFYQLYTEAETREELMLYRNDFIMNAYVCMLLAGDEVTEGDVQYAKVNYYIGNTGETMLSRVSNEALYEKIRKDASEHYKKALRGLDSRPDYYDKEHNMAENCRNGISTLDNS